VWLAVLGATILARHGAFPFCLAGLAGAGRYPCSVSHARKTRSTKAEAVLSSSRAALSKAALISGKRRTLKGGVRATLTEKRC
jgi:hypothetical protein